jgi:NADPH:quinone reductase-like Zn-dependent oxidoreductase
MKAIHLTAYGNPAQNLQMVEVPEPNMPSAGEALVRMEYAPVDYSDLLLANGVYFLNPQLPSVIGGEGAGIVEAIGSGVTSVEVGDRVTIPFRTFTWAEKVIAPADGLGVLGDAHVRIRDRQCRAARGTHAKRDNACAQHQ